MVKLVHNAMLGRYAVDAGDVATVRSAEIALDGHKFGMNLTAAQRRSGAVFNRFGLANIRGGGHSVEFYLDDISYTARRSAGAQPKFFKQTYVEAPYPHEQGGRRH